MIDTIFESGRFIGIRHRRKATKEGEARPTTVAIRVGGKEQVYDLESETHELDFLMARLPVAWRELDEGEEVTWFDKKTAVNGIRPHHCKWRKIKKDEDESQLDPKRIIDFPDGQKYLMKVPCLYDGLRAGDTIGMVLGGSGDRFAAALSKRGESVGATVWRIPPYALLVLRGSATKDDDHRTLCRLVEENRQMFYLLRLRDREGIRVKEALDIRQQAMKARIGCEQRLLQALVGRTFLNEEGHFPEGVIEDEFDKLKANDAIFQGLTEEEERRDKELERAVKVVGIWKAIFEPIKGCGPRLAAGLIAPIGDIRRFWVTEADPQRMEELYRRSQQLEKDGCFERDVAQVASRFNSGTNQFQKLQLVRSWQASHGFSAEAQLLTEAINCHTQRHALRRAAYNKGKAKLRVFCGVHCVDGKFARRRTGVVSNWNPNARQALYLLGDQCNRRPDSEWGKKLLANKEAYRAKHPHPIVVSKTIVELFRRIDRFLISCGVRIEPEGFKISNPDGLYGFLKAGMTDISVSQVQFNEAEYEALVIEIEALGKPADATVTIYTPGHIHKLAIWKTLTQFVNKLFDEWTRLEKAQSGMPTKAPLQKANKQDAA